MKLKIFCGWVALGICNVSTLPAEDWSSLEPYQQTITQKEFCRRLDKVYNPSKAAYAYITISKDRVDFFDDLLKTNLLFILQLAQEGFPKRVAKKSFRTISELQLLNSTLDRPLQGMRIALDPGHIGGQWANMEERVGTWGNKVTIREGDKNLQVARHLKARLEAAGAQIYMTHDKSEPVTSTRPKDFIDEAREYVLAEHHIDGVPSKSQLSKLQRLIDWRAELYFYRRAEIAQRAENIRTQFPADLNICNHFNATELSGSGAMTKDNRHAFFINGCYGADEVAKSETRFYMFSKILEQSLDIELVVGDAITQKMLKIAKLPPVLYGKEKYQCRVNNNPYLYARNLAANRQYPGPCLILEPFYMNNRWTAQRLDAGDYDGVRSVAGGSYRSIFRDYADAVADAIIETYGKRIQFPSEEGHLTQR